MTKKDLITFFGTARLAAKALGYKGYRADNNLIRLPEVLTERQSDSIKMRMRAARIRIPEGW